MGPVRIVIAIIVLGMGLCDLNFKLPPVLSGESKIPVSFSAGTNKEKESLKNFFPSEIGNRWVFKGKGNEFAGFKMEVIYKEGKRFQVIKENSAVAMAIVYEVDENEIREVYRSTNVEENQNYIGETDDERKEIILKAPLKPGTKWESRGMKMEIVSVDEEVRTDNETFTGVLKVKKTADNGYVFYSYYKEGIGLIKNEMAGEFPITEILESYDLKN